MNHDLRASRQPIESSLREPQDLTTRSCDWNDGVLELWNDGFKEIDNQSTHKSIDFLLTKAYFRNEIIRWMSDTHHYKDVNSTLFE